MIQARIYQDASVESIFAYFYSGKDGNPLVALPTASGKSVVIAEFLRRVMSMWPLQRTIVATHVKELIEQNYKKMLDVWPEAPAGIYSAGLKQKNTFMPIIFGGIQSMVNAIAEFGWRDLLLIDEAHLVSGKDDSAYSQFIAGLKIINPNLKIIGFTATRWRLGNGYITDGPVFTDCCFDLCSMDGFNWLIEEGYLCKLIPKRTKMELDVSGVAIQAGEFVQNQLQAAVDKDTITLAACKEIMEESSDRQSRLIFASGVEHSDHVSEMMQSFGMNFRSVHSKIKDAERDQILRDFKSFKLDGVVNNNVLTTGFDHPGLDYIGMLRPTVSAALWVQMLGRGTRPLYAEGFDLDIKEGRLAAIEASGKPNCKVSDFAGNTKRLGPINDPVIPRKRSKGQGTPPVRICPECDTYNHARAIVCINCGFHFESLPKITTQASSQELIKTDEPIIKTFEVSRVFYHRKQKAGTLPMIKVSYVCGLEQHVEHVCLEHPNYAGKKARQWWQQRFGPVVPPKTIDEALPYLQGLAVPRRIRVWINKKYPEIMGVEF